jgi:pimeloyl-ACP methyl ester carboxylesterase
MLSISLDPVVAEPRRSDDQGTLYRYAADATAPFAPEKLTIVITHGWNPFPGKLHLTTPHAYAKAIIEHSADSYNVYAWDWNAATNPSLNPKVNLENAICKGQSLAAELKRIGAVPERTWLIGHSMGALLMASAAHELATPETPLARLTLLDGLKAHHEAMFGRLQVNCRVGCLENFWADAPSGFGAATNLAGVYNQRIAGPTPLLGVINPAQGDHVHVIRWYYNTICQSECRSGFHRDCVPQPATD